MGNSHHPKSTFTGIVKGENNRILRNCSKEQDYQETMEFLKNKFVNRKFPPQSISEPIIPFEQRQDLLLQNKFNSKDENHITFVCPYGKEIKVHETLEGNWDIFSTDDTTRKRLINKQVRVAYTHASNLSQKLVRAKMTGTIFTDIPTFSVPLIKAPSFPAKNISGRHTQCSTCKQLSGRNTYYSYQTKSCYAIQDVFSCDTVGAIYILDCEICGK